MLTQDDLERERYESRRKAQLDYNSGLKSARLEGLEIGEKVGVIRLCESLLGRTETPIERLASLPMAELERLADQLKDELRER